MKMFAKVTAFTPIRPTIRTKANGRIINGTAKERTPTPRPVRLPSISIEISVTIFRYRGALLRHLEQRKTSRPGRNAVRPISLRGQIPRELRTVDSISLYFSRTFRFLCSRKAKVDSCSRTVINRMENITSPQR